MFQDAKRFEQLLETNYQICDKDEWCMSCPKCGVIIHWNRIQFYKWMKLMLSKISQAQKHDFTYLKYLEPGMVLIPVILAFSRL